MSPAGFEPATLAGERSQTYALDRAAAGTRKQSVCTNIYYFITIISAVTTHTTLLEIAVT